MQASRELETVHPIIVEAVTLFNRMEEIQQEIARRAFELFEARGGEHGRDFDDWTAAEAELLAPITLQTSESQDKLELTADVPGFSEKDIEVAIEPRRLFLSGKKETAIAPDEAGAELTGRQSIMFFRALDLPAEIDTAKAEARFKDGQLILTLPKLAGAEETNTQPSREIAVE
jgi:HSP20 family molecular chaperone IbpA